MKVNPIISAIAVIALMTSCKSLKSITSKDTSSSQKNNAVRPDRRDLSFIENIEVTPGNVVTSKHKTINRASAKKNNAPASKKNSEELKTTSNPQLSKADIEKADYLQLKYAVKLDATVEKLNNIPLLQTIDHWWGTRYSMGGSTENGIDCSAFTQVLMQTVYNVGVSRTAQDQYNNSEHIDLGDLQEGDLVFFHSGSSRSKSVSHVGVYMLNNKFVHASTSNGVTISDLNEAYWKQHYYAVGRVIK
ncbi:MAG: C40 family peptidase [Chitinophagaceae bacterium]|nr:C40 family peptidase [Chitinophagaceae bacterium]